MSRVVPPTVFAPPFSSLLLCLHQGCHWPCLCFGREATVVTSGFIGLPFPVPRPRLRLRLRLRPCPDRETSGQGGRCQVLGAHGLASTELLVTPAAPPKRCSPCIDWESAKQSSLRGDKKKKKPTFALVRPFSRVCACAVARAHQIAGRGTTCCPCRSLVRPASSPGLAWPVEGLDAEMLAKAA